MDPRTRIVAVGGAVVMLVFVLELVRRRRLKEEYSILWVLTSLVLLVLAIWFELLIGITRAIGAVLPSSTLFFFGLVFALVMLLHFSVRVSQLERRVTMLAQEVGLLRVTEAAPPAGEEDDEAIPLERGSSP
jgi:hypothetical protein